MAFALFFMRKRLLPSGVVEGGNIARIKRVGLFLLDMGRTINYKIL
jgi:hypothetical protein